MNASVRCPDNVQNKKAQLSLGNLLHLAYKGFFEKLKMGLGFREETRV